MRGRPCRVWDSPGVLNRRSPRVLVSALLLALAVVSLSGCRTSPDVAAYVGEAQVTVAELESAVDARLADPLIAEFAAGDEGAFTRQVLGLLMQEEVYAAAAERYDVEVTDAAVRARFSELLGEDDPDDVYAGLAERGISRADVVENVRQQLIREEIAIAAGQATEPTDAQLQARYEEVREGLARLRFGYVTVPDQATADSVLVQLQASPDSYPAVAQAYPGDYTLPALEEGAPEELPPALAQRLAGLTPGNGFSLVAPEVGGVLVGFLAAVVAPTFEEVRPALEREAGERVAQAGQALVDDVRTDLEVTVNPRYGQVDEAGALVPTESGIVDILGDRAE